MLYAACAALIFVLSLAVPHVAKAHRLARLHQAQQKWAETMENQNLCNHLLVAGNFE